MLDHIKAAMAVFGILVSTSAVRAAVTCNNHSLRGDYAFKVQGANIGVLDSAGALHPFPAPLLVTGAGYFNFDGNGLLTKVDYNVGNGTPSITPAIPLTDDGFRTGQTGAYSVDQDCTGTLFFDVPGGREVHYAMTLVNYGQGILGVVKSEHAPSFPAALLPSGTSCDSGCELGDNILIEMKQNAPQRR